MGYTITIKVKEAPEIYRELLEDLLDEMVIELECITDITEIASYEIKE